VNVAGGLRLTEPAVDLPLACALYSARSSQALPEGSAIAGELSLAGERPARPLDGTARESREPAWFYTDYRAQGRSPR